MYWKCGAKKKYCKKIEENKPEKLKHKLLVTNHAKVQK